MRKTILRIKPHFMYHDNESQELNSKAIFGFSTLNWRGINCFGYGYILCVDQFLPSVIRPVPHTEYLPIPVPPQQYILDSDEKPTEKQEKTPQPSTSTDADFTADLQFNDFHRITQEELNDLIRNLDLPKCKAELLGSRLHQ